MTVTPENVREVFDYDVRTGEIRWNVSPHRRIHAASKAGWIGSSGYIQIRYKGKMYQAHRLAWLYVYGDWPAGQIDHMDGNPLNNAIANLRDVTQFQNQENRRRANSNNKTGLLGVSWHARAKRYRANIMAGKKPTFLGFFDTPEEAHRAYLAAKADLHPCSTIGSI